MAAALARSATCQACRYSVLQSVTAFPGLTIAQTTRFPKNRPPLRRFSTVPYLRTEHPNDNTNSAAENVTKRGDETAEDTNTEAQSVPWYLRVEPPVGDSHPVARRQELPPVPENAPAMLEDVLRHLSVEIGLDDLTLLDLRGRNPPPALGGNVIMIIGTARGIKHLNVSADRFCRWLRSTYKLRPYADGLLGRNELKIKLRRKTRKARVAGSSGSSVANLDDGITTGWICVNAGLVEDPGAETLMRQGVFEGFGKVQSGTRIVVQMFTEEKRAMMNLEELWAPKREREVDTKSKPEGSHEEDPKVVLPGSNQTDHHESNRTLLDPVRPPSSISFNQKRGFTTSSIHRKNEETTRAQEIYDYLTKGENIFRTNWYNLGTGPIDRESTPLLQRSYEFIKDSQYEKSLLRLMLAAAGVTLRHPAYTKEHLWSVYLEHTASGFELREPYGLDVARSFVVPRTADSRHVPSSTREFDVEHALRVLDYMSLEGSLRLNLDLFVILYKALIMLSVDQHPDTTQQKSIRIRNAMDNFPEEIKIHGGSAWDMMKLRLESKDIEGFWQIWHTIPFAKGSRTHDDYEFLFRSMAWGGDPASARESLATWIPMMLREQPPIEPQDSLLQAIASCIQTAGYDTLDFTPEMRSSYWSNLRPTIQSYLERLSADAAGKFYPAQEDPSPGT